MLVADMRPVFLKEMQKYNYFSRVIKHSGLLERVDKDMFTDINAYWRLLLKIAGYYQEFSFCTEAIKNCFVAP